MVLVLLGSDYVHSMILVIVALIGPSYLRRVSTVSTVTLIMLVKVMILLTVGAFGRSHLCLVYKM